MKKLINIGLIIFLAIGVISQINAQVAKAEKGTFALTNAKIYTITKGVIEKGTVVIKEGQISAVGASVDFPDNAKVIDCTGMEIYPGFIDSGTRLGLSEVGSISLTQDYREIGDINPHMQALTAVNPNSVSIPVTRVNGVTTVLANPAGGTFPGTSALINLVGYTPKQMYAGFKGVIVNYPSSSRRGRFDRRTDEDRKKDEQKKLKKINDVLEKARFYAKVDSAAQSNPSAQPEYNPELEALLPVIRGEYPLLLEVNREKDIESAIKWVEEQKLKVIFTGVSEGWRVADKLAKAKIPVITGPVLSTPRRASDRYDKPYKNAGLMHKAGVKVAIRTAETENVRNLPYNAGVCSDLWYGKRGGIRSDYDYSCSNFWFGRSIRLY